MNGILKRLIVLVTAISTGCGSLHDLLCRGV
jgi:hypothetical protein